MTEHYGHERKGGAQMKVFRNSQLDSTSIASNWVEALHVDRTGTLWAGTCPSEAVP